MKKKSFLISVSIFLAIHFLLTLWGGTAGGLTTVNLKVINLFVFAITLWTSRTLPNSYTSLLLIVLIGLLKFEPLADALADSFGSTVFIFMFSVLLLSHAFQKSGLADRISQSVLNRFGKNNHQTLFCLMTVSYLFGMLLTAIAGVSMALPIARRLIEKNELKKGDRFAKACLLGITYGGLIGGVATPLGTPVNLLMMKYLKDLGGYELSFFQWMGIGLPLSFLLLLCCFGILVCVLKIPKRELQGEIVSVSPLSAKEKKSVVVFSIVILLFLSAQALQKQVGFIALDLNTIALICALLLVLPPFEIVEWKSALKDMDWECLVFLAGSIALGYVLYRTETASAIAKLFFHLVGNWNPYLLVFVLAAFTVVMHLLLSSNTVTGTVIVPILISFAQQMGVSPWYVAAPAVFCVSLAFLLPTESPTNIMTYQTGYYTMKDMLGIGSLLTIVSITVIGLFLIGYGGLTGLYTVG